MALNLTSVGKRAHVLELRRSPWVGIIPANIAIHAGFLWQPVIRIAPPNISIRKLPLAQLNVSLANEFYLMALTSTDRHKVHNAWQNTIFTTGHTIRIHIDKFNYT